jgi:hypothetical protein
MDLESEAAALGELPFPEAPSILARSASRPAGRVRHTRKSGRHRRLKNSGAPDHPAVLPNGRSARRTALQMDPPVLLVVDQRITMFFGSRQNMKSVIAAKAAALIAWRTMAQRRPLGAVVFNDHKVVSLPPRNVRLRILLILHAVLSQNHSLSHNGSARSNLPILNQALYRAGQLATGGALVFLISDGSGYDEETAKLLADIARDNRLLVALVVDPHQNDFRSIGSFVADDFVRQLGFVEPGEDAGSNGAGITSRQMVSGLKSWPRNVPLIPISTRDNVTRQVSRLLKKSRSMTRLKNGPAH